MEMPIIYLRGLRQADHTVFSVANGQKYYIDPLTKNYMPYSSGQQVKRCMLDLLVSTLGEGRAPVEFQYYIDPKEITKEEPNPAPRELNAVLPLNPKYPDMLLGGYMFAESKAVRAGKKTKGKKAADETEQDEEGEVGSSDRVIKRRSPLSISAMRPIHPLLATMMKESAMTFDRTGDPSSTVALIGPDGKKMTPEKMMEYLELTGTALRKAKFLKDSVQQRAYGIFVYDVAIDLRRLFAVSNEVVDPEISADVRKDLLASGWVESRNAFGKTLVTPQAMRERIIPALSKALLEWAITSNQSTKFSLLPTLAVAISDRANQVANAIRPVLHEDEETGNQQVRVKIDYDSKANLFVEPIAEGYIPGASGDPAALDNARQWLIDRMMAYPYEG